LDLVSYSILGDVERLQLIALIDAEIERLQQARLLIAPSLVPSQWRSRPQAAPALRTAAKKTGSRTLEPKPSAPAEISALQAESPVSVTRIPARKRSGLRFSRRTKQAAPKPMTALTGAVPLHPVAAPPKREEKIDPAMPSPPSSVDAHSASAFGQAISRGLASLNR
jgi:hypothetical protein